MKETWIYKYGEHTIEVKNNLSTELYVDGQLQDRKNGIVFTTTLTGKLNSGEDVKASLGGFFSVKCSLFVNNVLQEPIKS